MEYKYKLDYQKIARHIREARLSANLTQAELAEKIDVSTNAIAKLENNLMNARLSTLINIANVLNLDINFLLSDDQEKPNTNDRLDHFLNNLILELSPREKSFIIHVINGLQLYDIPDNP